MLGSIFERKHVLFRSAFAACIICALALIWSHRFLPISDYPDWVYEGFIVAELIHGESSANYSFKHYPVPYSGTVALLGVLDLILPPEVSGKVMLSLCVILFAISSIYLLSSLQRDADNPLMLIPLLFLLNTFFFWGELNYLFGLSIFFLYCGYLFRRIYRAEAIDWLIVGGASIAMFFCHFIPYAIAILVTLTVILIESRIELVRPFIVSFAPSIGLTIWYAVERLSPAQLAPYWTFWTAHQFAGRWIAAFSPFPEFLPWLGIQAPWMKFFAIVNLVVAIVLILVIPVCMLASMKVRAVNAGVLVSVLVCGIAVVASGYQFEGMVSPGERFLYPALWIGLCWLIGSEFPGRASAARQGLAMGLIGLIACQIVFMQLNVGSVSNELALLYSKLRSAPTQSDFCVTYETYRKNSWDKPHRSGLDVLLTNHASAPRLPYYLYLERKTEAPIFQIGILNYSGDGNNDDLCKSR